MSDPGPNVTGEDTPNPNTAKFILARAVAGERSQTYADAKSAAGNPLAKRLFAVDGIRRLLFMENLILVTKTDEAEWSELVDAVQEVIRSELAAGPRVKLGRAFGRVRDTRGPGGEPGPRGSLRRERGGLASGRVRVSAELRWTVKWLLVGAFVAQLLWISWWSMSSGSPLYLVRLGATAVIFLVWVAFTEARE